VILVIGLIRVPNASCVMESSAGRCQRTRLVEEQTYLDDGRLVGTRLCLVRRPFKLRTGHGDDRVDWS